ncbi:peptidoglycan DD-metalloendopeptidase family protein [Paenibacillus tarimensis]
MNDENKPRQKHEESPKTIQGGRAASSGSSWKKLLSKKWVTPAVFMAAAAIIVTLMWIYQGAEQQQETTTEISELTEIGEGSETADAVTDPEETTLEVISSGEDMQWPVLSRAELEVIRPFYDAEASNEERMAALVQSGNTYTPHMGIDLAKDNEETFDVLAALSGKVSHVEQHATNGYVVEISHGDGLTTVYQSLSDVTVKAGDEVKQGMLFAKAGRNEAEKELGVHLHFEVRKDGKAINPNGLLPEVQAEVEQEAANGQ